MLELSAPVIAIVGPTASGKTDAAQIVAERLGGEVVSADSMQIYRGMDIGTGKLPASERRVPHHGFDLVDPGEPYSAALFQAFARRCFRDIDARGKRAVLCGGTGQYVQAAIDDFVFPKGDQVENPVRERWTAYAEEHGNQALWEALEARDPASAAVIHPNNVRRVVRAFELLEEGASYAEQKQRLATVAPFVPAVQFGLAVEPAILNERIDARVDAMVAAGLVDEVRGLLTAGFRDGVTGWEHHAGGGREGHQDGHAPLRQAPTHVVPSRQAHPLGERRCRRCRSRGRRDSFPVGNIGRLPWLKRPFRVVEESFRPLNRRLKGASHGVVLRQIARSRQRFRLH